MNDHNKKKINEEETVELETVKVSWFTNPFVKYTCAILAFVIPFILSAGIWAASVDTRIVKLETSCQSMEKIVDLKIETINNKISSVKESLDEIKQILRERK